MRHNYAIREVKVCLFSLPRMNHRIQENSSDLRNFIFWLLNKLSHYPLIEIEILFHLTIFGSFLCQTLWFLNQILFGNCLWLILFLNLLILLIYSERSPLKWWNNFDDICIKILGYTRWIFFVYLEIFRWIDWLKVFTWATWAVHQACL